MKPTPHVPLRGVSVRYRAFWVAVGVFSLLSLGSPGVVEEAAAGGYGIQPGDWMVTGNAGCTMSFVYDGVGALAGKVYMGTAAHCVGSVGQRSSTTAYGEFGTVAFRRSSGSAALDYAFIEVDPALHAEVVPWVRGHPGMPNGVTDHVDTLAGEPVFISGYGLGFSTTYLTREQRVGVLTYDSPNVYRLYGPIIWGDSGGPILHWTGKALGIVSRLNLAGGMEEGPTVQKILADSAAQGFTVQIRLAV